MSKMYRSCCIGIEKIVVLCANLHHRDVGIVTQYKRFKIACEENKGKLDIARLVGYLRRPQCVKPDEKTGRRPQCVKPGEKTGRWQQHYYYPPGRMSNYESCMPATPGVVMTTSAKVVATSA